MSDEMNISAEDTANENKTPEYKFLQGIHAGTFKRYMRETYGCEICERVDRWRSEDGKWFDVFYVPILLDELKPKDQDRVVEKVFDEEGKEEVGVHYMTRNYHVKDKEIPGIEEVVEPISRQGRPAEYKDGLTPQQRYYQRNKEKIKARSRQQWLKNKENMEYREKRRAQAREYQREKHGARLNSSETVRRNLNRKLYSDAIESMNQDEVRIADLMAKDELGTITEAEMLELENLLNITGGIDEPESIN